MAFSPEDLADIEEAQLARYENRFPGRDTSSESFLGKLSRAEAGAAWDAQKRMQRVSLDSIPSTSSSYDSLANWATALGLSDGAGGYGPLKATAAGGTLATEGAALASGTPASVIADATELTSGDGTVFQTVGASTVGGGGTVTIAFKATTTGTAGNVGNGTVLTFTSPPLGVASTVTVTTACTGGDDGEDDTDAGKARLYARVADRLANPPRAVTASSLRQTAEGVSGVDRAYVYPLRQGTGSADVVVTAPGTGVARTAAPVSTVQTAIDDARTVGTGSSSLTAMAPTAATGIAVRVRAVGSTAYPFDVPTDTSEYEVDSWNGGTLELTLTGLAGTDLKTAITNGDQPRIQVANAPVPTQVKCDSYVDGGGKTTITLLSAPATAPTAGKKVYIGAEWVPTVAGLIRAYIDSLGPSRASGYADAADAWNDTLDSFAVARVALDAADANGVRYLFTLETTPTLNGATTPITGADPIASAPEILTAASIVVTP